MKVLINRKRLLWILSGTIDLVGVTDLFHGKRVAYIANRLLSRLASFPWSQDDVIKAGLLHDCGVSSTDVHEQLVLNIEWEKNKYHCERGKELLLKISNLKHLARSIRLHHTRWNLMEGTKDDLLGNLIFLADRIDILAATAQKDILITKSEIVEKIKSLNRTLFNPEFVKAFLIESEIDSFWLNWHESHSSPVMGFWYHDNKIDEIEYNELKELFTLFSACVDGKSPFTFKALLE